MSPERSWQVLRDRQDLAVRSVRSLIWARLLIKPRNKLDEVARSQLLGWDQVEERQDINLSSEVKFAKWLEVLVTGWIKWHMAYFADKALEGWTFFVLDRESLRNRRIPQPDTQTSLELVGINSSSDKSSSPKNKAGAKPVSKLDGISDDSDDEIAVLAHLIGYDAPYWKELDDEVTADIRAIVGAAALD
ncbi:hypothetical protein BJ508DRAFT_316092 [Ascobolus immersus RN42]|uniref:Uncharacterized protein n=1 Tax=Ascobolus immersus RN42 TaxID=1160509 RepID=A0A3N4H7X0_ASCIM|nr:hypothetical protein BJ508DRAFT_316092 [Ascobolus immersus RN42]